MMKHYSIFSLLLVVFLGVAFAAPRQAQAAIQIFACEPEWASLAQEIGKEQVEVFTATTAQQDVHHVRAKPSLLAAMRKADLVVCSGASLEAGWLPILLKKAGGPQVQPETQGWLMAAENLPLLEVMEKVDRSMGHIHPEGNPHVHLDPNNIKIMAETIADRLSYIDPANGLVYGRNLDIFLQKWQVAMNRWDAQKAALQGKQVVVYHGNWAYMLKWLGLRSVISLEPKPGIPPTAAHLEKVLQAIQGQQIKAILVAPFEDGDAARWLSEKSGIPVIALPYTIGGSSKADSLEGLFEETINLLQ